MASDDNFLISLIATIFGIAIVALGLGLFFIPIALLDGWALTYGWRWFIVPIFHVQQVGVIQMAGIALFAHGLRAATTSYGQKVDWKETTTNAILSPFMFLAAAWLLHWLLMRYGA